MLNKYNVIIICFVCNKDLYIMYLVCDYCYMEIKGEFSFLKFNYIYKEIFYFIEVFVKNRGNIKVVEKEMNISYFIVKKYLDEVIILFGYSVDEDDDEFVRVKV